MKNRKLLYGIIFLGCTVFLIARMRNKSIQATEDFAADMKHIGNEQIIEVIEIEEAKNRTDPYGSIQFLRNHSPRTDQKNKNSLPSHPERNTKCAVEGQIHSPFKKSNYKVIPFNLSGKVKSLSANQIDQHLGLYAGYVKKWNQIEDVLQTVSRKNISPSYSPFRALKVGETYAMNGTILHELYFENLGTPDTSPLPETKKLLEKYFGSVANYLQDLKECGLAARGWVLTCYSLFDGSVRNYVLDSHNDHVPIMVVPLIVLDVYEHAYMIEFGTQRPKYLKVFVDNINWPVIETRIKKWVK